LANDFVILAKPAAWGRGWYNEVMVTAADQEALTYEPLEERELDRAMAAVVEQLRRQRPTMIIR
jgi:hypothetical protein